MCAVTPPGLKGFPGESRSRSATSRSALSRSTAMGPPPWDTGGAVATITVNSEDTLIGMLRGHLPPIVMELRGRMRIAGDVRLALQALYGLQAGSPWAAATERPGG